MVASRWGQTLRWGYFAWSTTPPVTLTPAGASTGTLEIQALQPDGVRGYSHQSLFQNTNEQRWGSFLWGSFLWSGKAANPYRVFAPEWKRGLIPEPVITRSQAAFGKHAPGFPTKADGLLGLPQRARWLDAGSIYYPSALTGATQQARWGDAGSFGEVFYTWGGTMKWGTFLRWRG